MLRKMKAGAGFRMSKPAKAKSLVMLQNLVLVVNLCMVVRVCASLSGKSLGNVDAVRQHDEAAYHCVVWNV